MNFKAKILTLIRKRKNVSKKRYFELPEVDRKIIQLQYNRFKYEEILPPEPNPAIPRMRKKLKKTRTPYREKLETINGVEFIIFESVDI